MTHTPVPNARRNGFHHYERISISPQVLRLDQTFRARPVFAPRLHRRSTWRELGIGLVLFSLPVAVLIVLALVALSLITVARGLVWLARWISGGF